MAAIPLSKSSDFHWFYDYNSSCKYTNIGSTTTYQSRFCKKSGSTYTAVTAYKTNASGGRNEWETSAGYTPCVIQVKNIYSDVGKITAKGTAGQSQ